MVVMMNYGLSNSFFKFSISLFVLTRRIGVITFGDLQLEETRRIADELNDVIVAAF